jgi:hypothetical protein
VTKRLSAGRELDQLVHTKLFTSATCSHDYEADEFGLLCLDGCDDVVCPLYSTCDATALKVIEKIKDRQIRISNKACGGTYWWVYIDGACAQGSTLAEAICLASIQL